MAKRCDCHRNLRKAIKNGMEFYEAYRLHAKPGYHEHRCECPCGCKKDTVGYALCAHCSWNEPCGEKRISAAEAEVLREEEAR
jgi:hypothetical protein